MTDTASQSLANEHSVITAKVPEKPVSYSLRKPQSAVLMARKPDTLVSHLRTWPIWNGRTRVLVLAENESVVIDWLTTLWSQTRAVNVVVMVVENENVNFYTWFPYQINNCINVSNIVKISATELFPEKVNPPLHDCPLTAVTSPLPPLVVSDSRGVEPRLFHDIAGKLGMTTAYKELPPNKYVWTTLDIKRQPANGLQMVWENQVDLTFSQLSQQFETEAFAEFLPSHTQDRSVFFAPGPKPAPRATAIYRAFSPRTWILVISTSVAIYLMTQFVPYVESRKFSPAFLETIGLILNQAAVLPKTRIFRYFSMLTYMYSIHITTVYLTSLIIFLSDVPREKSIRTWEDLDNSPFPVEFHEGQRYLLSHVTNPHIISMLNRTGKGIFTPYLHMASVANPGNLAVLGPKLSFGAKLLQDEYFDEFGYPKVVILTPSVFNSHLCFYVSKGHPLFPLMSRHMLQLVEAGMPQHYAFEESKLPRRVSRQLRPFGIENVEGPFVLYGLMLCFSFTFLLAECCIGACKKKLKFQILIPKLIHHSQK